MNSVPPHSLLSLLFPGLSIHQEALCNSLCADQFIYADVTAAHKVRLDSGITKQRRTVALGPDSVANLVTLGSGGVILKQLHPQGSQHAARRVFPLLEHSMTQLICAAVHQKALHVLCRSSLGTTNQFRVNLGTASSEGQPSSALGLLPVNDLPRVNPRLSAVDHASGVAYMLTDDSSRSLFQWQLGDQANPLQELMGHLWPAELKAVGLLLHAGKLLALTLTQDLLAEPATRSSSISKQQMQVWALDVNSSEGGQCGSCWEIVQESETELPHNGLNSSIHAAPYQSSNWLVLCRQPEPDIGSSAITAVLVYDCCRNSWSASMAAHSLARPETLVRPSDQAGGNEGVASSKYFAQQVEGSRNAAAVAAAAAASSALKRQEGAAPRSDALQEVQQHCRQSVAYLFDEPGNVMAVWQQWAPLPASRLGEIAAPHSLPYDLRQTQAVRAAVAAGRDGGGKAAVFLRVAADPSLPSVCCPPSAAQQCGEIRRLLEVMDEDVDAAGSAGDASSDAELARAELHLPGIAREEHGALQQLVRCLTGQTHAGLLEATQLLDVTRLADLLDAPALLAECIAVLECLAPGPEMFAPMLALVQARQYNPALQHLALFYRHALAVCILLGQEPLLRWALHGIQAGVDTIVEICTEVAAKWLPLDLNLQHCSPAGDLAALESPDWQRAAQQQPENLRPLLAAFFLLLERRAEACWQKQLGGSSGPAKKARTAFQQAASRPPSNPVVVQALPYAALSQRLQRALQQLQRGMPRMLAHARQQRTAEAFKAAEARAARIRC